MQASALLFKPYFLQALIIFVNEYSPCPVIGAEDS
jgi:hypothetical protein